MILRDRCSTLHDLASLFRGRRSTLDRWSGKSQNTLVRGRQLCIQLSILEGRLAEFFRFDLVKFIEDVLQNCCIFHHRTWRKSHKIASFFMLSLSKTEEAVQNSFVVKLARAQTDR